MTEKKENTLKISVSLITDEELRQIDNNFESIVNEFTKQLIHNKELAIAQHIIQKQQKEIEHWKNGFERELEDNRSSTVELLRQDLELQKKDKIIDLMAKKILEEGIIWKNKEEIKQYFEKKVGDKQYE